ncbi:PqqD family protein [Bacteroides caecigallinarum]|uniref:PqqD family protein n=1 Tax=Bacteroides caecigallinarum TaxID=1411144 RepID=UPI001F393CE4|nr:PqqD family protein [Bacteroides caecigallinarum]MCF2736554.1 PqqD family protein [Bacteroides caecigallinarum]MDN0053594.1 PqqD family protein [Bacteroides caecigallinarum]MDN0070638.1 PqqD family protein [Bacteroides caecigallinarum]
MRIKKGFVLRELVGQKIVTGEGLEQIDFNKLVSLNSSAAYLWEHLVSIEFDLETMVDLLLERYDIERSVALKDARALLDNWKSIGLIED